MENAALGQVWGEPATTGGELLAHAVGCTGLVLPDLRGGCRRFYFYVIEMAIIDEIVAIRVFGKDVA